ncbi:unnamed protein product [Ceratitis capitata]|uniref:(Mediterranean fruit fly) hypothetical protein n=1 Tax=Ceratitis capitata TaxID=7213 RepID=A0A811UCJ1_CERCA|nr:unnamed protein product [Ceratitis capitata]
MARPTTSLPNFSTSKQRCDIFGLPKAKSGFCAEEAEEEAQPSKGGVREGGTPEPKVVMACTEEKCSFRDVAGNFTNDNRRESEYSCRPTHNCGRAKQQPPAHAALDSLALPV